MGIPLFFLLGPDASAESWGSCLWREQNRKSRETSRHLFFGCEALYEERGNSTVLTHSSNAFLGKACRVGKASKQILAKMHLYTFSRARERTVFPTAMLGCRVQKERFGEYLYGAVGMA